MPVRRRGWLFQYFEKLVCGVAAILLLIGLYDVWPRNRLPQELKPDRLDARIEQLARRSRSKPPPLSDAPRLQEKVVAHFRAAGRLPGLGELMTPPQPEVYDPIRVGVNMEFEVEFRAPLAADSLTVMGNEGLLEVVKPPGAEGDYRTVVVRSRDPGTEQVEGEATLVGMASGVKHIYPVRVSRDVTAAPPPPAELRVQRARRYVVLECKPPVGSGSARILGYEIWRRDWSDPLAEYERVGGARASQARGGDWAAVIEGIKGLSPEMKERIQRRIAGGYAMWRDTGVTPGRVYAYKARAVGVDTFPQRGEFTDPVNVRVLRNTDFKFTLVGADSVRFELLKRIGLERFLRKSLWIRPGDKIETVYISRQTGEAEPMETGYTLVDFHSQARVPGTQRTVSRVICADESGSLSARYAGEVSSEDLWAEASTGRRPGERRPRR